MGNTDNEVVCNSSPSMKCGDIVWFFVVTVAVPYPYFILLHHLYPQVPTLLSS